MGPVRLSTGRYGIQRLESGPEAHSRVLGQTRVGLSARNLEMRVGVFGLKSICKRGAAAA
jgi:hypothetical protein